jgi:hypothetical protein
MSTASETKVGGMKLGAEPKKVAILVALLAGAIGMFIYNSQSGGGESSSPEQVHTAAPPVSSAPVGAPRARAHPARRSVSARERATLRIQTVDPRNGDVDPTLRLDLLSRLHSIQPLEGGRSLFEMGPAPVTAPKLPPPVQIIPKPLPAPVTTNPAAAEPAVNIPLKFYGFVRPKDKTGSNRGFFLDGDNILVASEGELLKQRYLVVELTPGSAKLEDTQLKKGQTLPLVPEARNEF